MFQRKGMAYAKSSREVGAKEGHRVRSWKLKDPRV